MNLSEHWRVISRRIVALRSAAELYGIFQGSNSTDMGAADFLSEQVISVLDELKKFQSQWNSRLPQDARDVLESFIQLGENKMRQERALKESRAGSVLLVGFESHMTALLAGTEEIIRSRTERALLQLAWQLVADESIRGTWKKAFAKEPLCEQLGAAHLIGHGICAFKVRAGHSETDLVINEPLDELGQSPGVDGFVLTEWKRVNDSNVDSQLQDARGQLSLYTHGALSSMTLSTTRYVIAVSMAPLKTRLKDVIDNGVICRQVNLVIDSPKPSLQVKAQPRPARTTK